MEHHYYGKIMNKLNKSTWSLLAEHYRRSQKPMECKIRLKEIKMIVEHKGDMKRAKDWTEREPETLDWIESFEPNCSFWDIGASVGCFSMYAAAMNNNIKTYAFEPHCGNFHRLMQNIQANQFEDSIIPFFTCFSDKNEFINFNCASLVGGTSMGQMDNKYEKNKISYGMQTTTINNFLYHFAIEHPRYIKMDVDGSEFRIVKGMGSMLESKHLQSILIEVDSSNNFYSYHELLDLISSFGFKITKTSRFASTKKSFNVIWERQ